MSDCIIDSAPPVREEVLLRSRSLLSTQYNPIFTLCCWAMFADSGVDLKERRVGLSKGFWVNEVRWGRGLNIQLWQLEKAIEPTCVSLQNKTKQSPRLF